MVPALVCNHIGDLLLLKKKKNNEDMNSSRMRGCLCLELAKPHSLCLWNVSNKFIFNDFLLRTTAEWIWKDYAKKFRKCY